MRSIVVIIISLLAISNCLAQLPSTVNGYTPINDTLKYEVLDAGFNSKIYKVEPAFGMKFIAVRLTVKKNKQKIEMEETKTLVFDSLGNSYVPIGVAFSSLPNFQKFGSIAQGKGNIVLGTGLTIGVTRLKNNLLYFSLVRNTDEGDGEVNIIYEVPVDQVQFYYDILGKKKELAKLHK